MAAMLTMMPFVNSFVDGGEKATLNALIVHYCLCRYCLPASVVAVASHDRVVERAFMFSRVIRAFVADVDEAIFVESAMRALLLMESAR